MLSRKSGSNCWCTPGMGVNLWGASPLYENHSSTSTSQWQGRKGDRPSEGSLAANVRADGQKPHTRLSPWVSEHHITKPTGSGDRVNAAVVHGKFTFLSGEICATCDRIVMRESGKGQPGKQGPGVSAAVLWYESRYRETRTRQHLTANPYSALHGNMPGERAEVSRRHSSSDSSGRRPERGKEEGHSISFGTAMSPTRMSRIRARCGRTAHSNDHSGRSSKQ